MKKIHINFLLIFLFSLNFAQTPNTDSILSTINWEEYQNSQVTPFVFKMLFSGIDRTFLTTNIFYPQTLPFSDIDKFKGLETDSIMDETNFQRLYTALYYSFEGTSQLIDYEMLLDETPMRTLKFSHQ